ncbi:response regulator, partial [bacterium]|nr:response regulator [bacterium]
MRRHLSILSIDDDPGDIELLRRHLDTVRDWAVDLRAFTDCKEGLRDLVDRPPDIVLLDYEIGGRSGLDVFYSITSSGYPGPVIMLTGQGDEDVAVDALQAGVADYLRKETLGPGALRRSLGNAIEKTMLRNALSEHRRELEEANERLTARNDEIRRFYQTLSHEMKTPLTVAREFVAMVMDGLTGPITGAQSDNLRVALESCDQMAILINDLLDARHVEEVVDQDRHLIA